MRSCDTQKQGDNKRTNNVLHLLLHKTNKIWGTLQVSSNTSSLPKISNSLLLHLRASILVLSNFCYWVFTSFRYSEFENDFRKLNYLCVCVPVCVFCSCFNYKIKALHMTGTIEPNLPMHNHLSREIHSIHCYVFMATLDSNELM